MSKQVTSSVRDTAAAADGRKLAEVTAEQIEREIASYRRARRAGKK